MENPKADTSAHVEYNLAVPTTSLDNTIGVDDENLLKLSAELPDFANLVEKGPTGMRLNCSQKQYAFPLSCPSQS